MYIADRTLWLTADRKRLVNDGDPAAAFLFACPGDEVSDQDAERYGVKAAAQPEDKAAPRPADKQMSPPANKQRG